MLRAVCIGFGALVGYFAAAVLVILAVRPVLKNRSEPFRKLLHMAALLCVPVVLAACPTWQCAAGVMLLFGAIVFPVLLALEKTAWYRRVLPERRAGELKSSLLLFFFTMSALIALVWGGMGEQWRFVILAAVLAWGLGDAAAALVGTAFGRRRIRCRLADGKKTVEGSACMCAVSALAILAVCLVSSGAPWYASLAAACLVAPACAAAELFSRRGLDTVIVPLTAACLLFATLRVFTLLGL